MLIAPARHALLKSTSGSAHRKTPIFLARAADHRIKSAYRQGIAAGRPARHKNPLRIAQLHDASRLLAAHSQLRKARRTTKHHSPVEPALRILGQVCRERQRAVTGRRASRPLRALYIRNKALSEKDPLSPPSQLPLMV